MLEGRCQRTCRDRGLRVGAYVHQRGLHTGLAREPQSEGRGGRRGVGAVIADERTSQRARLSGDRCQQRVGVRHGRTRGRAPSLPRPGSHHQSAAYGQTSSPVSSPVKVLAPAGQPPARRPHARSPRPTPPLDRDRTSLTPSHVDDRRAEDSVGHPSLSPVRDQPLPGRHARMTACMREDGEPGILAPLVVAPARSYAEQRDPAGPTSRPERRSSVFHPWPARLRTDAERAARS